MITYYIRKGKVTAALGLDSDPAPWARGQLALCPPSTFPPEVAFSCFPRGSALLSVVSSRPCLLHSSLFLSSPCSLNLHLCLYKTQTLATEPRSYRLLHHIWIIVHVFFLLKEGTIIPEVAEFQNGTDANKYLVGQNGHTEVILEHVNISCDS